MVVLRILSTIIRIFDFILFLRVILSWFPVSGVFASVYDVVYRLTEPFLRPIRAFFLRFDFFRQVPIDFSPIVLFFLIELALWLVNSVYYFIMI